MEMEGPTRIDAEREVKQSGEKGRNQEVGTRTTQKPKHDKIKKNKKEQYGEYFVQKKWNKLRVKKKKKRTREAINISQPQPTVL